MLLAPQNIPEIERCLRCSRPLSNPVSMFVGFGPICSEILGVKRPEYDELMKLNPANAEHLSKLAQARQKLEQANNIEGTVTLEGDLVITRFNWGCNDFEAILSTVKKFPPRHWNPDKKQWETNRRQLPNLVRALKAFPNIAIDEALVELAEKEPPQTETLIPSSKLSSIAEQMKHRLNFVDQTKTQLKNGLMLFLKKEGDNNYKVLCAREEVLPSLVEVRVIGNAFFGAGTWSYGKAKTDMVKEGYVIISKIRKEESTCTSQ